MLEKLKPVLAARFDDEHVYMAGTRLSTLQQIIIWTKAGSPTDTFWVHGTAGTGKSTIANTTCEQSEKSGDLAGSFFCERDIPEQRDPRRILPSLSFTLATMVEPHCEQLLQVAEKEPDITIRPVTFQLTALFIDPFSTLQEQGYSRQPPLFPVDALDESGDNASRVQTADCLCRVASLASWLKIFVTSRPLPELVQIFESSHSLSVTSFNINQVDAGEDIISYTRSRLEVLVGAQRLGSK